MDTSSAFLEETIAYCCRTNSRGGWSSERRNSSAENQRLHGGDPCQQTISCADLLYGFMQKIYRTRLQGGESNLDIPGIIRRKQVYKERSDLGKAGLFGS